MKTIQRIGSKAIFLSLIWLMSGCAAFVAFEKPQPFFKMNMLQFEQKIRGVYIDSLDSRWMKITENSILIVSSKPRKVPVNEIYSISNAGMIEANLAPSFNVKALNPTKSLVSVWNEADTVFFISDCNILRQFKGKYYLNYKEQDKYWHLEVMALEQGELLKISTVYVEDLKALEDQVPLDKILDENGELVKVVLKPNKKQLKKLMRNKDYQLDLFVGYKMNSN